MADKKALENNEGTPIMSCYWSVHYINQTFSGPTNSVPAESVPRDQDLVLVPSEFKCRITLESILKWIKRGRKFINTETTVCNERSFSG